MRYLVRLLPPPGTGRDFIETVRSLARSLLAEARNPKWTTYGALEVDVFAKSRQDFQLFLAGVEPLAKVEFAKDLNVAPPHRTKAELVSEARGYFNSERYWECHETLEAVWRNLEGEEKRCVQGVILVCAAFVHHQKDEDGVAMGILARAEKQLSYCQKSYLGIQLLGLRDEVAGILRTKRFRPFEV